MLPDKQTGVVRAHIQPDGSAKYEIVEDVAWDWIEPQDEVFQMAERGASLLFGTLAQRSEHNRKRLDAVLEKMSGGLKIYDVNLRPPFDNPETIRYLASKSDLIKLNDEELGVVTHGLYPTLSLEKAAREYAGQVRCERLCVTAGARGAGLLDSGQWYWVDGRSVVVRDTVGAGDSFLAALISGLGWRHQAESRSDFDARLPAGRIRCLQRRSDSQVRSGSRRHGLSPVASCRIAKTPPIAEMFV